MSAAGDLFEIQLGTVAERKATSAVVRAYATQVVADHTTALAHTRKLAGSYCLSLPATPTAEMQATIDRVSKMRGMTFTASYVRSEIADHPATSRAPMSSWPRARTATS